MIKNNNKRGVSPVIANVLLISIVIVLAGIVFIWARGFVQEGIQKRGEPIDRACESTRFDAQIVNEQGSYVLEVNNKENVPLYGFKMKILGEGEALIEQVTDQPIGLGESAKIQLTQDEVPSLYNRPAYPFDVVVIPILLGTKKNGELPEPYSCPDQYGQATQVLS